MKPNLFAIGTGELAQDAFITWLLQWAAPDCRDFNPPLHTAATCFTQSLLALQNEAPAEITCIKADRQWQNIDVWAEINATHLLIIEDKVGSGPHSDQLTRYRTTAQSWCQQHDRRLVCVYLKTQNDSETNLNWVKEQGYAVFTRRDFLALLDQHQPDSDIYHDFRDRLREMERSETQFSDKPIGAWVGHDWKGFFQALEQRRPVHNWSYVNNPAGGFWNAILNWPEEGDIRPYMQLEEGRLCFKIGEVYDQRSQLRGHYHDLLMSSGGTERGLERPARFGSGTYMTVALVPRAVWLGADDQRLDLDATVSRLNRYETWFLETLAASASPRAPEAVMLP